MSVVSCTGADEPARVHGAGFMERDEREEVETELDEVRRQAR